MHCAPDGQRGEDRHGQIEAVARYADQLHKALGMPGVTVLPLLVVHGSRVRGGHLEAVLAGGGMVRVLGPEYLVPTLAVDPRTRMLRARDPQRAAMLARQVDAVLRPYGQGG